jgi:hypothetical protein
VGTSDEENQRLKSGATVPLNTEVYTRGLRKGYIRDSSVKKASPVSAGHGFSEI